MEVDMEVDTERYGRQSNEEVPQENRTQLECTAALGGGGVHGFGGFGGAF
jgi:hypothetical protein